MEVTLGIRKLFTVQVDPDDVDLATDFYWALTRGYACRPGVAPRLLKPLHTQRSLHRAIAERVHGDISDFEVDHKDHNPLNNTRENLRLVSSSQNKWNMRKPSHNTSGYKGVLRSRGKWVARIKKGGKTRHIGTYEDLIEAAKAYDKAALELFGEFACVNFPETNQ